MDDTFSTLSAAVVGGAIVGLLARPISWRLFFGALSISAAFLFIGLWRAARHAISFDDLLALVSLSADPQFHRYYSMMAIAYGAALAALIIAGRVLIMRKGMDHEP